jgi:SAM-dependent methyltransferase
MEYAPQIFDCQDIPAAKEIILTHGPGFSTEERWEAETRWLADRIKFPSPNVIVVDYGCGIGRVAKFLPNPVIGVDISPTMRAQAKQYVGRPAFSAISPESFATMVEDGLRVGGAVAVWALQHVLDVRGAIDTLMTALHPGGVFWLLDLNIRHVPHLTLGDHVHAVDPDGVNILPIISRWCKFEDMEMVSLPFYGSVHPWLRKYVRKQDGPEVQTGRDQPVI